jgi:hypothetical protein
MSDEIKDVVSTDEVLEEVVAEEAETALVQAPVNLNEESLALISQIIAERDEQKARDLTHLFNANQNKKTMVRVNKLSDLLDTITDQALARFTTRPDEISNKELFDGLKVVQDLIERGQKQVSGAGEMPLIQVNQQTNEVNIGSTPSTLSRDSREKVKHAVLSLISDLSAKQVYQEDPIDIVELKNVEGDDETDGR